MRERLAIAARKTVGSAWGYPALGVLVELAYVIDSASLHRTPSAVSFLLAVVSGAGVVLCGRRPLGGAFAVSMAFVATALFGVGDSAPDVSFLAPAIAAYAVAAHADWEGAATGLVVVLGSTESAGIRSGNWVPWIYVALAPWVVGRIVASRRRLVGQLEARTRELDRERGAFAGLAVRRERAQIARDLHDIVSHNMAVMVVQAGAGRIAPPVDPEQVAESFRRIRVAADAALVEMDQLVDVLDSRAGTREPGVSLAAISELVQQARFAGLEVSADISVSASGVPLEIEHAAYRAVQEGLTNVLKHAPGSHVELRLQAHDAHLHIEVSNRGGTTRGRLADTGSGVGLAGVAERVRAHGGELTAGATPGGGWRLAVRLPMHPAG